MKNLPTTILLIVILCTTALAKGVSNESISTTSHSLGTDYNFTVIGRSLGVNYTLQLNRHSISIGTKYHINRAIKDNQCRLFFNRGYAANFTEHLGLTFTYSYTFYQNDNYSLFTFYNLQLSKMRLHNECYVPIAESTDGTLGYVLDEYTLLEPFLMTEQSIGIGANFNIYKDRLSFNAMVGIGAWFADSWKAGVFHSTKFIHEYLAYGSIGINYKFKVNEE